ncbi:hypothetical protein ACLQ3J_11585 [Rhodococcus sp. DT1]|uniref:hypothetical protein n=1 Tax=unclassified Rhodococcus (in: high G+C Gram-positive bacteria) TaxID=192944 RepID=UPI003BB4DAE5
MALLASVPVLLALVVLLYFVSCRIVDHEIRSAEREYGGMPADSPAVPDPIVPGMPPVPGMPAHR